MLCDKRGLLDKVEFLHDGPVSKNGIQGRERFWYTPIFDATVQPESLIDLSLGESVETTVTDAPSKIFHLLGHKTN